MRRRTRGELRTEPNSLDAGTRHVSILRGRDRGVTASRTETHPEWDQVKIVVSRPHVVRATGMVEMVHDERREPVG